MVNSPFPSTNMLSMKTIKTIFLQPKQFQLRVKVILRRAMKILLTASFQLNFLVVSVCSVHYVLCGVYRCVKQFLHEISLCTSFVYVRQKKYEYLKKYHFVISTYQWISFCTYLVSFILEKGRNSVRENL